MNKNKQTKELKILKAAIKAQRLLSKATRNSIEDPAKLCDECMNSWTWYTLAEEKLCDECYKEKYVKTKMG